MYETATVEQLKVANDDIINTCTSVVESLKNLWDREKDSSFKDVSIKYVAYVITYYKEFKKKIPYLERELTAIEEKELNSINAKLDEIRTKKENVSEEVSITQEKFAEKFWYTLE